MHLWSYDLISPPVHTGRTWPDLVMTNTFASIAHRKTEQDEDAQSLLSLALESINYCSIDQDTRAGAQARSGCVGRLFVSVRSKTGTRTATASILSSNRRVKVQTSDRLRTGKQPRAFLSIAPKLISDHAKHGAWIGPKVGPNGSPFDLTPTFTYNGPDFHARPCGPWYC